MRLRNEDAKRRRHLPTHFQMSLLKWFLSINTRDLDESGWRQFLKTFENVKYSRGSSIIILFTGYKKPSEIYWYKKDL